MDIPFIMQICIVTAAGLIGGSFASAMAHRIPQDQAWTGRERSRCPSCSAVLTARDLVPLFSWLFLRGRCRHCSVSIGAAYPLTELTAAVLALGLYAAWGWGMALPFLLAAVPFLLAHIIIDARHMILPDVLNIILGTIFAALLIFQSVMGGFDAMGLAVVLGAGIVYPLLIAVLGLVMRAALRKEALGWGDVKFFAVAGLGLGLAYLPVFLMMAGVFGVLSGLWWRWRYKSALFPFGPALILAFYACLLLRGAGVAVLPGG